jgi:hypothetical protein
MDTPLVVAQGALGEAGHHADLALSDAMRAEDAHDRAYIAPLACFKEVLTCENLGQPLSNYRSVYGHSWLPVPRAAAAL